MPEKEFRPKESPKKESSVSNSALFFGMIRDDPERALSAGVLGFIFSSDTARRGRDWPKTPVTAFSFAEIADAFGYGKDGEGTKGKKILDIGSGMSDFGDKANKLYGQTGTRVVELDPIYSRKNKKGEILAVKEGIPVVVARDKYQPYYKNRVRGENVESIAGVGQKLPFRDKSFDEVISNFGISVMPPLEIPQAIAEAMRVAKERVAIRMAVVYNKIEGLKLPKGITLIQQNAIETDLCLLEIDPGKISPQEARVYFEKLVRMEKPPFQFWADDKLGERRLGGGYYLEAREKALGLKK